MKYEENTVYVCPRCKWETHETRYLDSRDYLCPNCSVVPGRRFFAKRKLDIPMVILKLV